MDYKMALDTPTGMDFEKDDVDGKESPKEELSEFDKLKLELEKELLETLPKEHDSSAESNIRKSSNCTTDNQKSYSSKSLEIKKPCKAVAEKTWLSSPLEEAIPPYEKLSNLIVKIKIFERSLVVNGFSEDVSLYTLSRAWMKNQKTSLAGSYYNLLAILAAASKRQNNGAEILQKLQNGESIFICSMPATLKDETGTSRLPTVEQLGFKHKPDIEALDRIMNSSSPSNYEEYLTSKESLLGQHKRRWRRTKSNWIKHIRNVDRHNAVNFSILETLFKSHMKEASQVIISNFE